MILRILHWGSRCVLAGLFIYSGYIKLQAPLQFAATIASYDLLPLSMAIPLARYLPWVEVVLGALLLIGWKLRYVALGTAGLLVAFIAAMGITYFRGIEADCGCFGSGERISLLTLGRDALILLPALFLAWKPSLPGRLPKAPEGHEGHEQPQADLVR
jgi:uncharacterized membrane protein YphA (DoxX/SURF4 family)